MSIVIAGPSPKDSFTLIENDIVRNASLSWKARGVLCWLLSHSPGWETNVEAIVSQGDLGRDGVNGVLRELELAGHLRRSQKRNLDGTLGGSRWEVFRSPTVDGSAVYGSAVDGPAVNGASLIENQKKKTNTSAEADEAAFLEVFEAWRATKANPASCLPNAARRKVVRARRKEGYTTEQLVEAVRAWPLDPWPERKHHNDMTVLLRGENVERMRDLWQNREPEPGLLPWRILLDVMAENGAVRCVRSSMPGGLDEANAISKFRETVEVLSGPGVTVTGRMVYPDGVTYMALNEHGVKQIQYSDA
jgi:hypothetical protein